MTPYEKLTKLLAGAVHVSINVNEHETSYKSVEAHLEYLEEAGGVHYDALPEGWRKWHTLCEMQVYPWTMVGFWTVWGETLEQCLAQVSEDDLIGLRRSR